MNSSVRKICVFTSTRAEYGLLRRLILKIDQCPHLELLLLVSGTHLVADQGMTIKEIQEDGFANYHCVDIDLSDDSPAGICRSMGSAVSQYGQFLSRMQPDLLLVLGDRFETFCCATAAQVCRIPIAHIHGGETTEGAIDEAFRHSITKMAHLHFPCCEQYRLRIIQMGESPDRVFNVGALGVENIRKMNFMEKAELEQSIGFLLDKPFFLITFHPVTLERSTAGKQFSELLTALDNFREHKCIFTQANADTDGRVINKMMYEYVEARPERCLATPSLGYVRYLSAMNLCDAVIGNSSSGIVEGPLLKIPTVNIGDRQKGRIRMESIIDCEPERESIETAIWKSLSHNFKREIQEIENPFEKEGTSVEIVSRLTSFEPHNLLKKQFFDLKVV